MVRQETPHERFERALKDGYEAIRRSRKRTDEIRREYQQRYWAVAEIDTSPSKT